MAGDVVMWQYAAKLNFKVIQQNLIYKIKI